MSHSVLCCYMVLCLLGSMVDLSWSRPEPLDPECLQPLGMQSKKIKDSAIKTGEDAVTSGKEGYYARLNNENSWCIPNIPGHTGPGEFKNNMYIEVTFSGSHQISAMALQGEGDYSYGKYIRVLYDYAGFFHFYKIDGKVELAVKGYKGDEIDYLAFNPALQTSKIKINLVSDSSMKCLRMEFYGCSKKEFSYNDYTVCQNKSKPIITGDIPTSSFNATEHQLASYAVPVKLKFSELDAWCIITVLENDTKISQYAQIDLGKNMLVYGAQVRGYVDNLETDTESVNYLAYKFKLDFSVGNKWEKIEGGKVFVSKDYVTKPLTFSAPYLARYIRIYISYNYMTKSCIKLQLFGCPAVSSADASTTSSVFPTTRIYQTEGPARVHSYDIHQGGQYAGITWKDTKYTRSEASDGLLTGGTGCLTEESLPTNPFIKPQCWIGWNKEIISNPSITLLLTKKTSVAGLHFHIYINESMGAYTTSEITLSAEDVVKGKACVSESYYNISAQGKDLKLSFKDIYAQKLTLDFKYGGDWILIRSLKVLLEAPPVATSVTWQTRLHQSFHIYDLGEVKDGLPIEDFNATCKLTFKEPVVSTTPFISSTTTSLITTTESPVQARVFSYDIPQGDEYAGLVWKDDKYSGAENKNGWLSGGTGCLLDKSVPTNPFIEPKCWIGWNKKKVSNPSITISLTKNVTVTGLYLHMYLDKTMGASTFSQIAISTEDVVRGIVCAPEGYYHLTRQVKGFKLSFKNIYAQKLTIHFKYGGDWILIRRIEVRLLEEVKDGLMLEDVHTKCKEPVNEPERMKRVGGKTSSSAIIPVICVILGLLFLALLLVFAMYRYRKASNKVTRQSKSKANTVVVPTSIDRLSKQLLLESRNSSFDYGDIDVKVEYAHVSFENDVTSNKNVYAGPDIVVSGDDEPKGYTEVAIQDYPQYSHPNLEKKTEQNGTLGYAIPVIPREYASLNAINKTNAIYQGSLINAAKYESPYKAIMGSSLYLEPAKVVKEKPYKIFPREQLDFKEKIGFGQFAEVWIAEASAREIMYDTVGHYNSLGPTSTGKVAVKKLRDSVDKKVESEFMKEVCVMSQLTHENVVRLLGICNDTSPLLMVLEYMENGDLNQFLKGCIPCDKENFRVSQMKQDIFSNDALIHIASQISAGLKYLHSEGFIHRDLATRNCLVGPAFQVKISDFGMSRFLYSKHYYRVEGRAMLPIRWMAPECLFYGKFTTETDVWSLGVTLWEIFSFAKDSPYGDLNDADVVEKACLVIQNPNVQFKCLEKPRYCTKQIYKEMCKCWQKRPEDRPTVAALFEFFKDLSDSSEVAI